MKREGQGFLVQAVLENETTGSPQETNVLKAFSKRPDQKVSPGILVKDSL